VDRPRKSLLTAYLLWLLLGFIGGHRFYLGRPSSAIAFIICCAGGAALYYSGVTAQSQMRQITGILGGGLVLAGLIVDLFMIPGMVERINNPRQAGDSFILPGASLDPSFQTTQRRAGLDDRPDRPRKQRIPEGYVMPWRQDGPDGQKKIYHPGKDDDEPQSE